MTQPITITRAAFLLFFTVLDTTWRVFVPTIGGTIVGILIDNATHRAPLFTTIFIVIGCALSIILVVLQIRHIRKMR